MPGAPSKRDSQKSFDDSDFTVSQRESSELAGFPADFRPNHRPAVRYDDQVALINQNQQNQFVVHLLINTGSISERSGGGMLSRKNEKNPTAPNGIKSCCVRSMD
jgi:hypothetical protein